MLPTLTREIDAVIAAGDSFNENTGWCSWSYDALLRNGWDPNGDLGGGWQCAQVRLTIRSMNLSVLESHIPSLSLAILADTAPVICYY